jgi:Skp family chaperone for outer membrane proteins
VVIFSRFSRFFFLTALLFAGASSSAFAQSSPGYFIPPSAAPAPAVPVQSTHQAAPAPAPVAPTAASSAPTPAAAGHAQLPPVPQLPALPAGSPPPTAVIGVLSVPDVMQKSTAAQGVQKIIQQRQAALGADAEKARAKIQAAQAQIVAERSKLTDAQLEAKEQTLRDEIATTQTDFQARNQAIQNSGQAALGQIESMLIAVIRQEAQARGMNLVLHREQVALNVSAFDITDDVAAQLNKLLPSVPVPPSVVTPGMQISAPAAGDDQGDGQGDGQ